MKNIMVNLYVAVILDTFQATLKRSEWFVSPHQLSIFQATWAKFDKRAWGFIPLASCGRFVTTLYRDEEKAKVENPLGIKEIDIGKGRHNYLLLRQELAQKAFIARGKYGNEEVIKFVRVLETMVARHIDLNFVAPEGHHHYDNATQRNRKLVAQRLVSAKFKSLQASRHRKELRENAKTPEEARAALKEHVEAQPDITAVRYELPSVRKPGTWMHHMGLGCFEPDDDTTYKRIADVPGDW